MPTEAVARAGTGRAGRAGNQAAARVLAVLSVFVDGAPSHGVTEISRRLGMTKSMVFRALSTLVEHGFLIRDESGQQYQLGFRVIELGQGTLNEPDIQSLCAPYLRQMHELTGETITLSVPGDRVSVIIDGIQGKGPIARRVPLGRITPLHASSASRVLLAFLPDAEIEAYLAEQPLERFTDTTLTDAAAVWAEVRRVRRVGYAVGFRDHSPNAMGAGFPVFDRDGRPVASVTVSGPADRLTEERLQQFIPQLEQIVADLNHRSRLYLQASQAPVLLQDGSAAT
jgi:DNA-binding IclR family transcriptional regulator